MFLTLLHNGWLQLDDEDSQILSKHLRRTDSRRTTQSLSLSRSESEDKSRPPTSAAKAAAPPTPPRLMRRRTTSVSTMRYASLFFCLEGRVVYPAFFFLSILLPTCFQSHSLPQWQFLFEFAVTRSCSVFQQGNRVDINLHMIGIIRKGTWLSLLTLPGHFLSSFSSSTFFPRAQWERDRSCSPSRARHPWTCRQPTQACTMST